MAIMHWTAHAALHRRTPQLPGAFDTAWRFPKDPCSVRGGQQGILQCIIADVNHSHRLPLSQIVLDLTGSL